MTGYAPSWLFGAIAVAAFGGVAACSVSVLLRPVVTGEVCRHGGSQPQARPLLVLVAAAVMAVAVVAATFRVLGA